MALCFHKRRFEYNTISFAVAAQSRNLAEAERSPVRSVASPSSISALFSLTIIAYLLLDAF
ncbi:hypothetical protein Csa_007754 [Cucumis sativus]|uniref:Uncharacterized protein n=1 Tax=Cucumis sativus TaxID=3659 RepID=A0A0A0KR94_CUCSA|nr:hypothetical protein Csa_007754 [Cucumis sativus]